MSSLLPADAEARRVRVLAKVPATALDGVRTDRRLRRTKLAEPLVRALQRAGYVVEDWRTVLAAASVVAREAEEEGMVVISVTVPRPHLVPEGELNPERSIMVEYVGGADDGLREPLEMDPVVPPNLAIALNGSVYHRHAYDLRDGTWLYARARGVAAEEEEEAPRVEDDPADWP